MRIWIVVPTARPQCMRNIWDNFLPLADRGQPLQGYLNAVLTFIMMGCVLTILVDSLRRWRTALRVRTGLA